MSRPLVRTTPNRVVRPAEDHLLDVDGTLVDVGAVSGWSRFGFTEEDLDPTPVPTGCPQCFRTGGGRCYRCPDRK